MFVQEDSLNTTPGNSAVGSAADTPRRTRDDNTERSVEGEGGRVHNISRHRDEKEYRTEQLIELDFNCQNTGIVNARDKNNSVHKEMTSLFHLDVASCNNLRS